MRTPLLSSHLYSNVTLSLSFHRNFHMTWTSVKRSPLINDHFFSLAQRWHLNTGLYKYIYMFYRYVIACVFYQDFINTWLLLTRTNGSWWHNWSYCFYGRFHGAVYCHGMYVSQMTMDMFVRFVIHSHITVLLSSSFTCETGYVYPSGAHD